MMRGGRLPRFADWLLRQAIPPGVRGDTILGDLREEFEVRIAARQSAGWWYRRQAFALSARYAWARLRHPSRPHPDDRLFSEARPMLVESLVQDLRYATRTLAKAPAFAGVLFTTLALGIGASTAIFSIVNGIVLRPLAFADSDRLVFAAETTPGGRPPNNRMSLSWPNYLDWRERAQSFAGLAAFQANTFTLTGVERPLQLNGRRVTVDFFRVLGVTPQVGRLFTDGDFLPSAELTAIVSDGFWRTHLAADPHTIGRTLALDSASYTIIGVLPPRFRLTRDDDVYLRLLPDPNSSILDRGNHQGVFAIGRLKAGVSLAAAASELDALAASLAREYPNTNSGNGAMATSLTDMIVASVKPTLLVLLGAVLMLLLIACVNVANLLIARGASRQHELAVRAALGGGRLRLARQLLVESTFLSGVGGLAGVLLAWILLRLLIAFAPEATPRLDEVRLDRAALLFAFAAATLCGVVFGALPAVHASRTGGMPVLVRARGPAAAASSWRIRRALMAVEVALALILLTGAGLMGRTLYELTRVDPGFDPARVVTMRVTLAGEGWTTARRVSFVDELQARLRALPGIEDAALTASLPIEGSNWNSVFIVADKPEPPRAELPSAAFTPASARVFSTLGIHLLRGRLFEARDRFDSPKVVIVNDTFARRFWPGENPIGKRLKQGWPESPTPWREVIGVVADVKFEGLAADTPLQVYVPILQEPMRAIAIVARTTGEAHRAVPSIEAAVRALDKDLPVYQVRTMPEVMDGAVARERVALLVLTVFSLVALSLASIGLYGIVSHGVTQRTHEIGVRMALGAKSADVLKLFVTQGLATCAAGAAVGLVGALGLSWTIETLLFGVTPSDPLTLAVVVTMLLVVSVAACYLPARRATRISPTIALRID